MSCKSIMFLALIIGNENLAKVCFCMACILSFAANDQKASLLELINCLQKYIPYIHLFFSVLSSCLPTVQELLTTLVENDDIIVGDNILEESEQLSADVRILITFLKLDFSWLS